MSGFSPAWLDLREPIDVASRCVDLVEGLAQKLNTPEPIRVLDLGAGTGANLRYLAPRLGGKQDWRLLDNDDDLLAWLPRRLREWADEANLVMEQQNRDIVVGEMISNVGCDGKMLTFPARFESPMKKALR